jgi:hypothetical protein
MMILDSEANIKFLCWDEDREDLNSSIFSLGSLSGEITAPICDDSSLDKAIIGFWIL